MDSEILETHYIKNNTLDFRFWSLSSQVFPLATKISGHKATKSTEIQKLKEIKQHKTEQPLDGDCWGVQRGDRKWRDKVCLLKVG